jgi:GNAT superfamily N-acetyltransferase
MRCLATSREGRFELRSPETEHEWDRYHSIRERVLWSGLEFVAEFGPYDQDHPEQYGDDYTPLILVRNGIVTGTLGLHDMGEHGNGREVEVRGVAIEPACQGQGYGGIMLMMADWLAGRTGYKRAGVWSHADVVLYYARNGYTHRSPEYPPRMECPVTGAIPMTKRLDLGIAQNDGSVLIAAA